jgi:hypothetical protein
VQSISTDADSSIGRNCVSDPNDMIKIETLTLDLFHLLDSGIKL